MNFPVEIGIGEFKLSAHLVFETLAFVIGFRYYLHLKKNTRDRISGSNRIQIIIGAAIGAFIFSRFIGALEDPFAWAAAEHSLLYFFKNKTITGGLLGGLAGVEIAKRLIGEKHSSGDLFTIPLILAIMIGRIGCFSSGIYEQTYGVETTLPWGMDLGDGLLRHPVALYELLFLGILWLGIHMIRSGYRFKSGYIFKFFMIFYFIFRFFLEFIKPGLRLEIGITTIQIVCIIIIIYYGNIIFNAIFKPNTLLINEHR